VQADEGEALLLLTFPELIQTEVGDEVTSDGYWVGDFTIGHETAADMVSIPIRNRGFVGLQR
jgi:hypothetical protein